jgi:hypothetical protein
MSEKARSKPEPNRIDLDITDLRAIVTKTKGVLDASDHKKLLAAMDTLFFLTSELGSKNTSIKRLRNLIFGPSSEKTKDVKAAIKKSQDTETSSAAKPQEKEKTKEPKKRKGHGRNSAQDYKGAEKSKVVHEEFKPGQRCDLCLKGKLYPLEPKTLVRVKGVAPLMATVYEIDRLRCNLCGEVFTAKTQEDLGDERYDETAAAMIALLKYGTGLPFHRLEKLEGKLGIPLPASTQWDVVDKAAKIIEPAYKELVRQAAQGKVLHNDDTTAKILDLAPSTDSKGGERRGVYTSSIVATDDDQQVVLFFTGHKHAGENLADVLAQRKDNLGPPIQMCDALAANTCGDFDTIIAHCIAHARRKYVDVSENFPEESLHVLELLKAVYYNDGITKELRMSDEERLKYHQEHSKPIMNSLEAWCELQFEEKNVEPNSGLGEAIKYMTKHWEKLTLFLRVPGAPLDNNRVERSMKMAILHRKNAMFFKTQRGAYVGDLFMSLIYTCELSKINVFDYLVELQRHSEEVSQDPNKWLPWNYAAALSAIEIRRQ